jgi:hypothetical protein
MPLTDFKIDIHPFAGYRIAYLKKKFFGCIWVKIDEQLQLTATDFAIVEFWMDRYGLTLKQVKEKQAA